ncbi:MAG: hypothetical protein ABIF40_00615 [archaeon]
MAKQKSFSLDEFFLIIGDFIDERLFLWNEAKLRRQALKLQKRREKLLEKLTDRKLKAYEAKRKLVREHAAERRKEREKEKLLMQKRVKEKKEISAKFKTEKLRQRLWSSFWRKFKHAVLSIFVWFHFVKIRRLIREHEKYGKLVEKQENEAMQWHKRHKKLRQKKKR